jgi:hypothetical protein
MNQRHLREPYRDPAISTTALGTEIARLAAKLPGLGVTADLAALSTAELWGVYYFLARVAEGR